MIKFDHIEVHVKDANKYAIFLKKLFAGGRYKKISENDIFNWIHLTEYFVYNYYLLK